MTQYCFAAVWCLLLPIEAWAASPFADNMVLQREMPAAIWGRTAPGQKVSVTFSGQKKSATANDNGDWSVSLDPLPACEEGKDLSIDDGTRRTIHNVVVGEVWLCSGQSNMAFTVRKAADAEATIASARDAGIRLLGSEFSSGWRVSSPDTTGDFSAVAYAFAREIRQSLHVPLGLISLSLGGTDAARWIPRTALRANDVLWNACLPRVEQAYARESLLARKKASAQAGASEQAPVPWDDFVNRRMGGLYERLIGKIVPYGIRGVIWYQGEADASYPDVYGNLFPTLIRSWRHAWNSGDLPFLFVQLPNFDTPMAGKWVRLREVQAKTLAVNHTGMAVTIDIGEDDNLHPLNKREVGRRLALIALNSVYGRPGIAEGPTYQSFSKEAGRIRIRFKESASPLKLLSPSGGFSIAAADGHFVPAQAEIERNDLLVWSDAVPQPVAVRYAWNTIQRVSLFNEAGLPAAPFRTDDWTYPYEGPRYASAAAEGGKMRIKFAPSPFDLKLGDKTSRDFQIAGLDHKFIPAQTRIDGRELLVWNESISQPAAVRYAWGNDELEISLFDNAGQAAPPFRTDEWPEK